MGIILDTNAISDLIQRKPALIDALAPFPIRHIPTIVLGEYRFGIKGSTKKKDLTNQLGILEASSIVLPVSSETACYYADVLHDLRRAGTPIPVNDLWIAAIALEHRLPLATRDAHFKHVSGLKIVSW